MRRGIASYLTPNKKLLYQGRTYSSQIPCDDAVWKLWKEMAGVRDVECDMTGEEWLRTVLVGKRNASLLCWKWETMATSDFEEDQSQQTVSQTTHKQSQDPLLRSPKELMLQIIVPGSTKYITVVRAIIIMR